MSKKKNRALTMKLLLLSTNFILKFQIPKIKMETMNEILAKGVVINTVFLLKVGEENVNLSYLMLVMVCLLS